MTEKGQTSSMTSVTEEDTSADSESDTTESSYSNITSSILSSTDTDDKLTPGLITISISNASNNQNSHTEKHPGKLEKVKGGACNAAVDSITFGHSESTDGVPLDKDEHCTMGVSTKSPTTNFIHAYGTNPLPLKHADQVKKYKKKHGRFQPDSLLGLRQTHSACCKENLGIDDTDNKLTTDFSDTSSIQGGGNTNNNEFGEESNVDEAGIDGKEEWPDQCPFYPNMSSASWYRARCFNQYWTHYNFVMDWYRAHVQAVETLQRQVAGSWGFPYLGSYRHSNDLSRKTRSKKSKKSKRASRRRSAKARQRSQFEESVSVSLSATDTDTGARSRSKQKRINTDEEEELEIEITQEMMEFIAKSYKHKMERDVAKQEDSEKGGGKRQNIEDAKVGQTCPSSSAPTERPGVRRTAEMKELYGAGAAMIHGMETALQMTFDKFSDKFQPKLWPNMPLKINFA